MGRTVARITAFAFDRLDHCRLFAADISAGTSPKLDLALLDDACLLQRCNLVGEDVKNGWILVAHVERKPFCIRGPSGYERALEHLVRIALEIKAVLEGAGFALVTVDGHEPRGGIGAHALTC